MQGCRGYLVAVVTLVEVGFQAMRDSNIGQIWCALDGVHYGDIYTMIQPLELSQLAEAEFIEHYAPPARGFSQAIFARWLNTVFSVANRHDI
jgi:hypothetical protein